ncbi:uncharacterized protein LOC110032968 [Phalaenopsis equestris]|uniref:uncharacterized protein LOC110032968 n=1 Tax=Phalaenopsis equestris TaxID=78828 RepID=UPI0009E2F074|nr:uncharacterized protein LOC110032968 [Phalaenopsis equestris]
MWTLHPQFVEEVYKVWRAEGNSNPWLKLWILQKKVAAHLKKWNWETFGNINDNLTTAQSNVIRMEKNFQMGLNSEADLHKVSEELLMQTNYTECFLKQKAVVTRFIEGDKNTSYYHACTNFIRKNNMIFSIHDSNGKRAPIKVELFSERIDYVQSLDLTQIPMEGEIKAALDFIDDNKVAGPDGFTAKFYKTTWNIISGEVVDVVQSFIKGMDFISSTITLILKTSSWIGWGDFRPISLTNVLSKVISKNWVPSVQKLKVPTLVLWNPPPKGWMKANIDGSFCKDAAGVRGIFRNSLGKCMLYFSSPTWEIDALETEIIAIYWAIYLAKQCNIIKLVVESDSLSCIRILNQEEAAPWNVASWTTKMKRMLINVEVIFQHILREGNTPAHSLAARGKDNEEIVVGTIPSTQLEILLHGDSLSIPYINCRD